MTTYLNLKTPEGVETIDEISQSDYNSFREFRIARRQLKAEYQSAHNYYSGIYYSQRCTRDWQEK